MEVVILEKDEDIFRFILRGVNVSFANALRRIMLAEVPTMAIEDVVILENTSALYDEIIAHRLGLIPLTTDLDRYSMPEGCRCGGTGCPNCQAKFILDVEAGEDVVTVYSRDLKSDDPKVKPVKDKVPIVKIGKGQRLTLEAYAQLGLGRTHAKWQPASCCVYRYMAEVNVDLGRCRLCGKCVEACPKRVLGIHEGRWIINNPVLCDLCRSCEGACESKAIKVGWDKGSFIFTVEPTGALPAEVILEKAAEILERKAEEFINNLEGLG